jgi:hypothetical protein
MYTIPINSNDNFETFFKKFIHICEEHKSNKRALAFAFILYDFENPQIAEVLENKNYWNSLNATSGEYLTVFNLSHKPEVHYKRPTFQPGVMNNMLQVNLSSNPSDGTNRIIKKYFEEDIEIKYPAVLFFQVHEKEVIDYILIELDEKDIQPAFRELQDYISNVVEVLKRIKMKNNSQRIFEQVETRVKGVRLRKKVTKAIPAIKFFVEFGSSVRGFF